MWIHETRKRQSKLNNKKTIILLLLSASAFYLSGCSTSANVAEQPTAAVSEEALVKVEAVAKISMGEPREQLAEVSASSRVDITAEAGGMLLRLVKRNGDKVNAGDVIAIIDNKNAFIEKERAEAALKNAESSLLNSEAELSARRLELTNTVNSIKDKLKMQAREGTEAEQDETKRSLAVALKQLEALQGNQASEALKANVETARLSLEQAAHSWGNGEIKAPASGILTDVKADAGSNIQAGSAFGVVQNTEKVKLKAQLTETAAQLARNKREIVFKNAGDGESQRKAKVVYLSELPDAGTKLYDFELEVENTDRSLKPASRVQIQLTTPEEESVIAIPSLSIVREGTETFAFVLNGNKAEKRKIVPGRINGPYQEILEGLKIDDRLIVSGQHALKDGQTVGIAPKS
ncbi:efflux RND transporter periplasmic adaptor subunit [Cohnella herbarum]|uniref:Efflux RND transporter periplasmic adaptor subunit n=1 Tax=Cohnella herbarum TaxID=2728023 RepID=A0A7Z2ZK96_9BACL|nr:efflux RND transporter periplasmic adaptor subunit [Cohnella herbarum]QJD82610.1 efflux RND transporter periplasmic adaptor subunit [Cohnella herbarum]